MAYTYIPYTALLQDMYRCVKRPLERERRSATKGMNLIGDLSSSGRWETPGGRAIATAGAEGSLRGKQGKCPIVCNGNLERIRFRHKASGFGALLHNISTQ